LTKTEFELLAYLAKNSGRAICYEELVKEVWKSELSRGDRGMVQMCVSRLRKKIGPDYIVCVRGFGYKLE
jgi:DNA-binding response OmpR family regulator